MTYVGVGVVAVSMWVAGYLVGHKRGSEAGDLAPREIAEVDAEALINTHQRLVKGGYPSGARQFLDLGAPAVPAPEAGGRPSWVESETEGRQSHKGQGLKGRSR